jgi:hypothetical protein
MLPNDRPKGKPCARPLRPGTLTPRRCRAAPALRHFRFRPCLLLWPFLTPYIRFVRFAIWATSHGRDDGASNFMNKKDLWFLLIAVGVVALFTLLSIFSRRAPAMKVRPEHAGITRETKREDCWGCHTPDSEVWLRHPKKGKPPDQTTPCYVCHKLPDAGAATAVLQPTRIREGELLWLDRQGR